MKDTVITDEDVIWEMEWNEWFQKEKGCSPTEVMFEEGQALARLLAAEVVFLNSYWHRKDFSEEDKKITAICVNCNDVFAWGCADAESLMYEEIEDLYRHWLIDPGWGAAVWCIKKRKELPQGPVYDAILKEGIWDLDSMSLQPNRYDEARRKRNEELNASS